MIKAWHHTSLAVDDVDAAVQFFTRALGFEVLFKNPGVTDQIRSMTAVDDLTCDLVQLRHPASSHVLELIEFRRGERIVRAAGGRPLAPGMAHVAFLVEDLNEAASRIKAKGATPLGQVTQFEEGPAMYFRVPGGSFIELEQAG